MKLFGIFNIISFCIGFCSSLLFHNYIHTTTNSKFIEQRLGPAIGVGEILLLTIFSRHNLRMLFQNKTSELELVISICSDLSISLSFATGVVFADLLRNWNI